MPVEVYIEMLNMLGLTIRNGKVYDNDNMSFLLYKGNYICTRDCPVIHRKDTILDISNIKLMEYLANVLFTKEANENGLFVSIMATTESKPTLEHPYIKRGVELKTNQGDFVTDQYYNYSLAIINLFYLVSGMPLAYNLHQFDYTEAQMKEMYGKK